MSDRSSAAAAQVAQLPTELGQLVEAIAERVADKLEQRQVQAQGGELLDAAALAGRLGCSRDWVYEHADELGAIRLGEGARPRLAFDRARVDAYLAARQAARPDPPEPSPAPRPRRRHRQAHGPDVPLLPFKGGSV